MAVDLLDGAMTVLHLVGIDGVIGRLTSVRCDAILLAASGAVNQPGVFLLSPQ
jgi:hypothetical protein